MDILKDIQEKGLHLERANLGETIKGLSRN